MKNVQEAAKARAVLASYHPLWLRLGIEVVCGLPGRPLIWHHTFWRAGDFKPWRINLMSLLAGDDVPVATAQLATVVQEHFFNDIHLVKQFPTRSRQYYVSNRVN